MRHIVIVCFVFLLFCQSVYAAEIGAAGTSLLADRQAGDVKVVMYMTTW